MTIADVQGDHKADHGDRKIKPHNAGNTDLRKLCGDQRDREAGDTAGSVEDAGMLSDLLTTAVFVLGPEKGQQFMEQLPAGITGMIVDQQQHLHPVRGFEDQLTERNEEFPVE